MPKLYIDIFQWKKIIKRREFKDFDFVKLQYQHAMTGCIDVWISLLGIKAHIQGSSKR